jgi:catechol 2,3-dioxygenase-like lactoylglutathione lyase family enzyme
MNVVKIIAQLRTTDLERSIRFYTEKLGFTLEFHYDDFYAGVRIGNHSLHLKLIDDTDPSVGYVQHGGHFHLYIEVEDATAVAAGLRERGVSFVRDVHDTAWQTREFIVEDEDGHTLYFGQPR